MGLYLRDALPRLVGCVLGARLDLGEASSHPFLVPPKAFAQVVDLPSQTLHLRLVHNPLCRQAAAGGCSTRRSALDAHGLGGRPEPVGEPVPDAAKEAANDAVLPELLPACTRRLSDHPGQPDDFAPHAEQREDPAPCLAAHVTTVLASKVGAAAPPLSTNRESLSAASCWGVWCT